MYEVAQKIYLVILVVFSGIFFWLLTYEYLSQFIFALFNINRPSQYWLMPTCAAVVLMGGYIYGKLTINRRLYFYILYLIFALSVSLSVISDSQCKPNSCDLGPPSSTFLFAYTLFLLTPITLIFSVFYYRKYTKTKRIILSIISIAVFSAWLILASKFLL